MKMLSKVVWSDGMYLGPHHFQTQNRYFEDLVQFETSTLWFEGWGFTGYDLDAEALQNGTVSLIHARGVLPDGLPFQMPESDPLPPPRSIAELFPPTSESLTLQLGVPAYHPQQANCDFSEANGLPGTRYRAAVQTVHDENTGIDEKPVRLGQKNFQILLESEASEGFSSLPVARVMRDGSGHYVYDQGFVPPCSQISASERLMTMTRGLIDILEDKSTSLSRGRQGGGNSPGHFPRRKWRHSGSSIPSILRFPPCGIFSLRSADILRNFTWSFHAWRGRFARLALILIRETSRSMTISICSHVSSSSKSTSGNTWRCSSQPTASQSR